MVETEDVKLRTVYICQADVIHYDKTINYVKKIY